MKARPSMALAVVPVFQPVIDLLSGEALYFEALARSTNKRSHIELLSFAESYGFIELVDLAMLDHAAEFLSRSPGIRIGVNASVSTIERNCGPLVAAVFMHLQQADRLVVEITESIAVTNPGAVHSFIAGVKAAGAKVAFDDFGDGCFSFDDIVRFKPDIVKLAGVMLGRRSEYSRDVARVLSLAEGEGFTVVAENIDSEEKRQACIDLGIGYGQGFLLGELANTPIRTTAPASLGARRDTRMSVKS
ncbi:EAL domain-containing protein (plasmid) [Stenotrophomonas maltophilia]|uniref:EAL domain-containing protein n=1 Tax=Stenotrophomonas maltophilia TaxID=40324 RepID=UPI001D0C0A0A|nr:EAL domain-containing protein [Stenotrophomonas maltophilia]UXF74642.1 EAL domain-containing protein [Stenotrophomonas maltophilia]